MPMRAKIIGAGSIGNHLSNAARTLGWSVDLCDIDPAALQRTRDVLYPGRYGKWDPEIRLFRSGDAPKGEYDFIFIGTPPDRHIGLALDALDERPQAIIVEKPLCTPDLNDAQELVERVRALKVAAFVGYDHVVGEAAMRASDWIGSGSIGRAVTLDVEFREHWGGILKAHPWLNGPWDTYLGHWKRGGGAAGEHSHAANLWQHLAHVADQGRVVEVTATMDYVRDGKIDCDRICSMALKSERGLMGRVIQDVVTEPPRKMARFQGTEGYVEWHCGLEPGCDAALSGSAQGEVRRDVFRKTRPDDFIRELVHIQANLASSAASPISLIRGMDTMMVVAAAHKSTAERRTVGIDYSMGYTLAALQT